MKIATIIGTRPEIIRLSRVINAFDKYFDHEIVHTGQNYDFELNEIFFKDLEIRAPDFFLESAGDTAAETIANVIKNVDKYFEKSTPDAVLILGDTNSSLAALPAKRRKIPIFHMEAGNRCFDVRVPEEINRKIVDHISDINLTYSDIAREYLIKEGLPPEKIIKTGSPMDEVLAYYSEKIKNSVILEKLSLVKENFFLVSFHREENIESETKLSELCEIFDFLHEKYEVPIIFSTHPRTKKNIKKFNIKFNDSVVNLPPFSFTDYIALQLNSKVVLSDSGTITEESSILNFPAVNLRDCQERPEGFEEGSVIFTGTKLSAIIDALRILENQNRGEERLINKVKDYISPNLSEKVARIVISFTPYVNRYTWRK